MSRYVQNEGYSFITASNGVETLEKVRSEMPDLVLLDVNMPNKDGFEVLAEIRKGPDDWPYSSDYFYRCALESDGYAGRLESRC